MRTSTRTGEDRCTGHPDHRVTGNHGGTRTDWSWVGPATENATHNTDGPEPLVMDRRAAVAVTGIVGIFLLVQLGALALVKPFETAGYQAVEDPSDPTNSLVYVGAIIIATAVMLAAIRYNADWLIRLGVIGASGMLAFYVFSVVLPPIGPVDGIAFPAFLGAILLAGALWIYPEWYVIDAGGIVIGSGAAGLFGISFGVLPALLLLTILAIYDAISVYGTEHMLTLASGVMDLRLPVVLVIPLTFSYSFLDADPPPTTGGNGGNSEAPEDREPVSGESTGANETDEERDDEDTSTEDGGSPESMDRDAFFIGLGDAVIPAVLVASAAFFVPADSLGVPGIALTLPALGAMAGTLVGLLILMRMVIRGRAHAGLPLLNGGAITGYLLGAIAEGLTLVNALGIAPYL